MSLKFKTPVGLVGVTGAQMSALPSPTAGDTVYHTESGTLYYYNGASWIALKYGSAVRGETPGGTIDGSNRSFTLEHAPTPNTSVALAVYSDGIRIDPSQYSVSGTGLTFSAGSANIPVNNLICDYEY